MALKPTTPDEVEAIARRFRRIGVQLHKIRNRIADAKLASLPIQTKTLVIYLEKCEELMVGVKASASKSMQKAVMANRLKVSFDTDAAENPKSSKKKR